MLRLAKFKKKKKINFACVITFTSGKDENKDGGSHLGLNRRFEFPAQLIQVYLSSSVLR